MTNIEEITIDQPWIVRDLESLSSFRFMKAEEFPDDHRNKNAADYCQAMASAITALGPNHPIMVRYAKLCELVSESEHKLTKHRRSMDMQTGFSDTLEEVEPDEAFYYMEAEILDMISELDLEEDESQWLFSGNLRLVK